MMLYAMKGEDGLASEVSCQEAQGLRGQENWQVTEAIDLIGQLVLRCCTAVLRYYREDHEAGISNSGNNIVCGIIIFRYYAN